MKKTDIESYNKAKRVQIQYCDILTYTTGANIGRTQVYLSDKKAMASNHVNMLRVKDVNPIYLGLVMNSIIGRMQTDRICTGTAQHELYPEDISNFVIPLLPETMQDEIANMIKQSYEAKKLSENLLQEARKIIETEIERSNDS